MLFISLNVCGLLGG